MQTALPSGNTDTMWTFRELSLTCVQLLDLQMWENELVQLRFNIWTSVFPSVSIWCRVSIQHCVCIVDNFGFIVLYKMSLYKQNTHMTRTFIISAHYCTLLGQMCEVMILDQTCNACYYCGKSLVSSLFIFKLTHYNSLLLFLFITFLTLMTHYCLVCHAIIYYHVNVCQFQWSLFYSLGLQTAVFVIHGHTWHLYRFRPGKLTLLVVSLS